MSRVRVLDCTLRDGGYCNDCHFGLANSRYLVDCLVQAGVDIIECGFLTQKKPHEEDYTRFNTLEQAARLLPEDKLSALADIREKRGAVMFVGDGINDAPVLAGADVGAAMGSGADAAIEAAGGIDVQILGIGTDGHVGFNEPGSSLASGTRVKTLVEQTRADNARFFDDDINQVPTHCITQGIGTIMRARHLVLLAFGEGKAEAIRQTCEGGISAFCPASALQMHPHATIIVDEAAASKLSHKDYYEYAYAHKPAWQGI